MFLACCYIPLGLAGCRQWVGLVVNPQVNMKILPHQMPSPLSHPVHPLPSPEALALLPVSLLGAAAPADGGWSSVNRAASPGLKQTEGAESSDALLTHLPPSLWTCRPPQGQVGDGGSPWSLPLAECPECHRGWAGPAAAMHVESLILRGEEKQRDQTEACKNVVLHFMAVWHQLVSVGRGINLLCWNWFRNCKGWIEFTLKDTQWWGTPMNTTYM